MSNRLADITQRNKPGANDDIDFLLNQLTHTQMEVERQRAQRNYIGLVAKRDIERLRGLLARLEWAAGMCPACHVLPSPDRHLTGYAPHDPGCWLAAELAREGVG